MPLNLDTTIAQISEEQLNELFDEVPEKAVTANDLVGSKKDATSKDDKSKDADKKDKQEEKVDQYEPDIVPLDIDDLPSDDDEDKKEKDKKDDKKKDEKTEDKKDEKKDEEKKEKKAAPDAAGVNSVLKNTVEYLIEKGIWEDFDGREDLEITEEVYAELAAEQDNHRLTARFGELVDGTGPYGKAIIDFVSKGGNPDEIIDLFKEQKQIEAIDTKTDNGKRQLIEKYYDEVIGWKQDKIKKYVNTLITNNGVDDEVKEVQERYDEYYKTQLDRINEEQAEYQQEQQRREQAFESNIKTTLGSRKDLNDREKKTIYDSLLKYDKKLPDGSMVNDFYLKFAEMQNDPQKYVDLVLYVTDNENFKKRVQKQAETKAAEKTFSFVKGNSALSNKKGSSHDKAVRQEEVVDFKWS